LKRAVPLMQKMFFTGTNIFKSQLAEDGETIASYSSLDISPNPLVRGVLFIAGTFFMVIGMIGIVVRLLPTTPFLLLSAACYSKSSKRFHRWVMDNRLFGDYISNYIEGRGISLKMKSLTLMALWASILFSAFYFVDMFIIRILLIIIAVGVSVHILTLPTYVPSGGDEHDNKTGNVIRNR